jgi:hypothetical protein
MPERIIKLRLQDCEATLASERRSYLLDRANLVEALKRSIPERSPERGAETGKSEYCSGR